MLDPFLETLYQAEKKASARQEMVDAFMNFPKEELHKIAAGRVKLAYHGDGDWLEKFKGSPLYDQALALEEQSLQLDIEEQQKRLARKAEREAEDSTWDARDAICLKKRMLDLELVKSQGGEAQAPAKPMDAPTMNLGESDLAPGPDKISSVNIFYGQRQAALGKLAEQMREKVAYLAYSIPIPTRAGQAQEYQAMLGEHPELTPEQVAEKYRGRSKLLGTVGGGIGGAALGASLGMLPGMASRSGMPGLGGTALGTALGGVGGALLGRWAGGREAEKDIGYTRFLMGKHGSAVEQMRKAAAELQAGQREDIKSKNFAVHTKGGEEKYPIHDQEHAQNALTRVQQFGSADEKAKVFAAITKKYPALATRSSVVPEKQQAKAEHKLGLPPGGESQKKEAPKQKLNCGDTMKVGSLQFRTGVPFEQLTDLEKIAYLSAAGLEKDAFLGALAGGAKGMYNVFKSGLSKGVSKGALKAGYKATEAPGVMAGLKNVGHYGANWAKTNPGTAAGVVGAAGLGAGALAHKALSD